MAGRVSVAATYCCKHATSSHAPKAHSKLVARSFTTTVSRRKHGVLPDLSVSASAPAELTELLEKVRTKIFFPAHLRRPLQNIVYKTRNHKTLELEPMSVTIGSEDFPIRPINRMRDVPHSWKSLRKAMDLMGTDAENWRTAFPGLLEGFKTAGRKWQSFQWERVVRRAADSGMPGVVVEAARRVERTGLELTNIRVVREAFWGCRELAWKDWEGRGESWGEARTAQALRFAEQIAELMELDSHCGGAEFGVGDKDPRIQVDCLGFLLELAAVKAQKHLGGTDEDGKVRLYAERLAANLNGRLDEGMDRYEEINMEEGRKAAAADYELMRWVPLAHGIEAASEVLGAQNPLESVLRGKLSELRSKITALSLLVTDSGEHGLPVRRRGLTWAQNL